MRVDEILSRTRIDRAIRNFSAGSELFRQDLPYASYFILIEGWVALQAALEDGTTQIMDFVLPGGFLGMQPRSGAPSAHSAKCLTGIQALVLPRGQFDAAMAEDPSLTQHVLHITACHEMRAYDHIQNISRRTSHNRVAHLLVELFFRLTRHFPDVSGETVEMPLTLANIADALGLTPVHISRTLGELRDEGLLQFSRRHLRVLNPQAVMAVSGYSHATVRASGCL